MQLSSAISTNLVQNIIADGGVHSQIAKHLGGNALQTSNVLLNDALAGNVATLAEEALVGAQRKVVCREVALQLVVLNWKARKGKSFKVVPK